MPNQGFKNLFPQTDDLLRLPPEDLATTLLAFLNSLPDNERSSISYVNFDHFYIGEVYPHPESVRVSLAVREAWAVLVRDGFIAQIPGEGDRYFITKRGQSVTSREDIERYRKASLLPKDLLHPDLAAYVLADFNRADYETAVFKAFRHLEVAVRQAGGFADKDLGVDLMRRAFGPNGPLADKSAVESEQLAVAHLFAGAIGAYKNPASHRYVSLQDPSVVVELLFLASHLLRIVDDRLDALKAIGP